MQFLVEEAFATALELHDAAEISRADEDVKRQAALRKSQGRLAKTLERMGMG